MRPLTPTAVLIPAGARGWGLNVRVEAPSERFIPSPGRTAASFSVASADGSFPVHDNSPAYAGSARPPRTRIPAPAPTSRETSGALDGSVQVGEEGDHARVTRRGAMAALTLNLMARPWVLELGPTPGP